jgi:hypothetical protein
VYWLIIDWHVIVALTSSKTNLQKANPIPLPFPLVKNALKIFAIFSSDMPIPLSSTVICFLSIWILTFILSVLKVYSIKDLVIIKIHFLFNIIWFWNHIPWFRLKNLRNSYWFFPINNYELIIHWFFTTFNCNLIHNFVFVYWHSPTPFTIMLFFLLSIFQ